MTKDLDIRFESLAYTARFLRPAFDLWGEGGKIMAQLYDALVPFYGVTLQNFQAASTIANASVPILTVTIGNSGTLKFAYDRMEFTTTNFGLEFFQTLPHLLMVSTQWIRKLSTEFRFSKHEFNYFGHAYVKDVSTEDVLAGINSKTFESAGLAIGHGSIFHHAIPDKKWLTQLILDRSAMLPNALFIGFAIAISQDDVDFANLLVDGRGYLDSMLRELDLNLPELSQ